MIYLISRVFLPGLSKIFWPAVLLWSFFTSEKIHGNQLFSLAKFQKIVEMKTLFTLRPLMRHCIIHSVVTMNLSWSLASFAIEDGMLESAMMRSIFFSSLPNFPLVFTDTEHPSLIKRGFQSSANCSFVVAIKKCSLLNIFLKSNDFGTWFSISLFSVLLKPICNE